VPRRREDYKAFEDLKGETVGAQVGTVYVEPLKKTGLFTEVKIYDTIPDIMRDVNTGRPRRASPTIRSSPTT